MFDGFIIAQLVNNHLPFYVDIRKGSTKFILSTEAYLYSSVILQTSHEKLHFLPWNSKENVRQRLRQKGKCRSKKRDINLRLRKHKSLATLKSIYLVYASKPWHMCALEEFHKLSSI